MLDSWLSIGILALTILFYTLAYILSITAILLMVCKSKLKAALEVKNVIEDIKIIFLKKYTLSLVDFTIMAAYLMLFAATFMKYYIVYFIGPITFLNVFVVNFVANLMIYPLLIASQARLMGLIYLERVQSPN